jgi:hypothetical protein
LIVREVVQLIQRSAGERDVQNWRCVRVELAHHRRGGVLRQLANNRAHGLLDIDIGLVGVVAIGKLDDDVGTAFAGGRRDVVDSRDAGDSVFNWLGEQQLDVFG